jgi:hypothetical protein
VHIPRRIAVLKGNLSTSQIKQAFNIDDLIDVQASIKAAPIINVVPAAAEALRSLQLPLKSFADVKLLPLQFTLVSQRGTSDSKLMQFAAINKARQKLHPKPSPNKSYETAKQDYSEPMLTGLDMSVRRMPDLLSAREKDFLSAVKSGKTEEVLTLLANNRHLLEVTDSLHCTALHWAVKRRNLRLVTKFIERGADVEGKEISGRTPLMLAVQLDYPEIVAELQRKMSSLWSTILECEDP